MMLLSVWQLYVKDWQDHTMNDFIIQVISIVVILISGMIAVRMLGKKSISQLNLLDVLFIFVLSSTLGALITKPVRIFVAILVVITIIIFVYAMQKIQLKSPLFEKIVQGRSVIVYKNKTFNEKGMAKNNLTVDTIEAALRQKGISSIEACKTVVLETTGQITFEVDPQYEPIKKIYFDDAIKQILKAIDDIKYVEAKIPEMNNVFEEVDHKNPSNKKKVKKNLQ